MAQDLFVHFSIKKQKNKNPIKDWWSELSERRLKRKAKEKPKDTQPVRIKKGDKTSHSHGKKLHEKYMKNNTYGYNL